MNKKKLIFIYLLSLVATNCVFGQHTYWKMFKAKELDKGSELFSSITDDWCDMDFFEYDGTNLFFYSAYSHDTKPTLIKQKEILKFRLHADTLQLFACVDGYITFVKFESLKVNTKAEFLQKLRVQQADITNKKKAEALKQDATDFRKESTPENWSIVSFPEGFSMKLPSEKYYISKAFAGQYNFYLRDDKRLEIQFYITVRDYNGDDSLFADSYFPVKQDRGIGLYAKTVYYANTKKAKILNYRMIKTLQLEPELFISATSENFYEVIDSKKWIVELGSLAKTTNSTLSYLAYNKMHEKADLEIKAENRADSLVLQLPASYEVFSGKCFNETVLMINLNDHYENAECLKVETYKGIRGTLSFIKGDLQFALEIKNIYIEFTPEKRSYNVDHIASDKSGWVYYYNADFFVQRVYKKNGFTILYNAKIYNFNQAIIEFEQSKNYIL